MSKNDLGDVQYAGKVKTQTFKQFQLERLIKDGTVIPASKIAEAKEQGHNLFTLSSMRIKIG
jgi:hypothetical protein